CSNRKLCITSDATRCLAIHMICWVEVLHFGSDARRETRRIELCNVTHARLSCHKVLERLPISEPNRRNHTHSGDDDSLRGVAHCACNVRGSIRGWQHPSSREPREATSDPGPMTKSRGPSRTAVSLTAATLSPLW